MDDKTRITPQEPLPVVPVEKIKNTEEEQQLMQDKSLQVTVDQLRAEIKQLNSHFFVRMHNSIFTLLPLQFLKGLAFGLGTVLGATVVLSTFIYLLSQIEFLPIVGDWVMAIIEEIEKK